jgi:hypothetical protein
MIFLFLVISLLTPRGSLASAIKANDPLSVIDFKWGDSIEVVKGKAIKNNLSYVREGVVEGDAILSLDYQGKVFGIDKVKISTAFDNRGGSAYRLCSVTLDFPPNSFNKIKKALKDQYGYVRPEGLNPEHGHGFELKTSEKPFQSTSIWTYEKYVDLNGDCFIIFGTYIGGYM